MPLAGTGSVLLFRFRFYGPAARGIPVYCLLSELSDNPRGDSGDPGDGSHLVTGTEMAALAQKEPMLD